MNANDILLDGFERVRQEVHAALNGVTAKNLAWRPNENANSVGWLVWHLTRIQDDHIADAAGTEQVWLTQKFYDEFGMPFDAADTGWNHTSEQVSLVQLSSARLLCYYDAVHAATLSYISLLKPADYDRVVDTRWDPPVTLGVRLVSILSDDLQHAGQAAYLRGLVLGSKK